MDAGFFRVRALRLSMTVNCILLRLRVDITLIYGINMSHVFSWTAMHVETVRAGLRLSTDIKYCLDLVSVLLHLNDTYISCAYRSHAYCVVS